MCVMESVEDVAADIEEQRRHYLLSTAVYDLVFPAVRDDKRLRDNRIPRRPDTQMGTVNLGQLRELARIIGLREEDVEANADDD